MNNPQKSKSFWRKPEGITGSIILGLIIFAAVWLITSFVGAVSAFLLSTAGIVTSVLVLGAVIFMALDSKARALTSYVFRSSMRWLTGMFIMMDPIAILKSYVDDLKGNLSKMKKQITQLRGQMHKLKEVIYNNKKEINSNMSLASQAKNANKEGMVILKTRKAGRLKKSNVKLNDLYTKMEVLYRVLSKMYENSAILTEDIEDQVKVKEQERKAIQSSHSAMKSAMNIIAGNSDKRALFDQALEAVADDVSQKVGEMEKFMDMSENFMSSIDLQNGVFEEEGLKMLEKWEKDGVSLLLGEDKDSLILEAEDEGDILDLSAPVKRPERVNADANQYDSFFE